jgi:hypothetical protein
MGNRCLAKKAKVRYNSIKMSESKEFDPEVQQLAEQTIRYLVFVVRWLARRFALERLLKI